MAPPFAAVFWNIDFSSTSVVCLTAGREEIQVQSGTQPILSLNDIHAWKAYAFILRGLH
jgi:hypothetical protein